MATTETTQFLPAIQSVIDSALESFDVESIIEVRRDIPDTDIIPSNKDPHKWLEIRNVICVFVDMKNSTALSASSYPKTTTGIYKLFTETAVRIFHSFDAAYIDVRGDGVFALFNEDEPYRAFAATVSFKTFADQQFTEKAKNKSKQELGAHIGIDQATVLVRKVGISPRNNRTDRMNEVWAGKPVNMASKLASIGEINDLLVSPRYFKNITHELVRKTCGCEYGEYTGNKADLWSEIDLSDDDRFNFSTAHKLRSAWCQIHGQEFCDAILRLDPK